MKPSDKIENLIQKLRYKANCDTHDRILNNVLEQMDKSQKQKPGKARPEIWRIIMKSKITKLTTAAIIVVIVVLSINLWDKSISSAYAIEQTIQANNGIRYLHIKNFSVGQDEPREGWLQFDQDGNVLKMRAQMPAWLFSTDTDGPLVIVWNKDNENVEQVWNKTQNIFAIKKADENSEEQLAAILKSLDPREAVKNIQELESQGQVNIEIEDSADTTEPIIITVTYLPESPKPGSRKVFAIDPLSKLVKTIELYQLTDEQYKYEGVIELYDYNKTIDDKIFDLENEITPDTIHVDLTINNADSLQ